MSDDQPIPGKVLFMPDPYAWYEQSDVRPYFDRPEYDVRIDQAWLDEREKERRKMRDEDPPTKVWHPPPETMRGSWHFIYTVLLEEGRWSWAKDALEFSKMDNPPVAWPDDHPVARRLKGEKFKPAPVRRVVLGKLYVWTMTRIAINIEKIKGSFQ